MSEPHEISITIKSSADKKYTVSIDSSSTIAQLKDRIAAESEIAAERQRLIYSGRVLKDTETVESYKIQTGHTIHLVKSAGPKPSNPPSSITENSTTSNTAATSNTSAQIPQNIAAGQGSFNPLAGLTGARYAGLTQLPSASLFGPDGGMGALPDENQMAEMMESPLFQEGMQAMLSDPRILDQMIESSPQLRNMGPQVREMLQSEHFRSMMSNPDMMRQMMTMQRAMGAAQNPQPSFPAPGTNATIESTNPTSETANSAAAAANPFGALFPGGFPSAQGGANPFSFLGNEGAAGLSQFLQPQAATPADTRPPEERYESQLRQLNDMGFFDFDRNVQALRRSGGSVQGAVEYLLTSL